MSFTFSWGRVKPPTQIQNATVLLLDASARIESSLLHKFSQLFDGATELDGTTIDVVGDPWRHSSFLKKIYRKVHQSRDGMALQPIAACGSSESQFEKRKFNFSCSLLISIIPIADFNNLLV